MSFSGWPAVKVLNSKIEKQAHQEAEILLVELAGSVSGDFQQEQSIDSCSWTFHWLVGLPWPGASSPSPPSLRLILTQFLLSLSGSWVWTKNSRCVRNSLVASGSQNIMQQTFLPYRGETQSPRKTEAWRQYSSFYLQWAVLSCQ